MTIETICIDKGLLNWPEYGDRTSTFWCQFGVITRMFRIESTPQPRPLPSHRSVSRCSDVTEVEELCEVFENHGDQRTGRQTLL